MTSRAAATDAPAEAKVSLADIEGAAAALHGQAVRTPLVPSGPLSQVTGCTLSLKLETLQDIGSFKQRGAYVRLAALDAEARARGVIAMSAGNHAQGVAFHAQRLGIPATIVMPAATPFSKVERTRGYGARVVLHGDGIDAAGAHARELQQAQGLTFIHPYDDPHIIAGQGTVGLEILADDPDIDTIVVPIGGGGIISGIAIAAKALKPSIQVIGVEAAMFPSMHQCLRGEPVRAGGDTIADGIAVKTPGQLTRAIVSKLVDDILLVDETALETAIQQLVESAKVVAEGAGAASLAALLAHGSHFAGRRVAAVICGGNIDSRVLSGVLLRGLVRDARMVCLRVEITDIPGALARVARIIGDSGGNIVDVHHQRLFHDVPVRRADLDLVVETRNRAHVREIVDNLTAGGFTTELLSAVTHA